ncbi:hypothetical protein PUN28_000077 [Cardiocondyla obscurior]|uniref:Uncharacterized protein n=1 Tax=Cardiocondyla obscurior TaxID=286306 RepID=A0AAW2GXM3_9HYME
MRRFIRHDILIVRYNTIVSYCQAPLFFFLFFFLTYKYNDCRLAILWCDRNFCGRETSGLEMFDSLTDRWCKTVYDCMQNIDFVYRVFLRQKDLMRLFQVRYLSINNCEQVITNCYILGC